MHLFVMKNGKIGCSTQEGLALHQAKGLDLMKVCTSMTQVPKKLPLKLALQAGQHPPLLEQVVESKLPHGHPCMLDRGLHIHMADDC